MYLASVWLWRPPRGFTLQYLHWNIYIAIFHLAIFTLTYFTMQYLHCNISPWKIYIAIFHLATFTYCHSYECFLHQPSSGDNLPLHFGNQCCHRESLHLPLVLVSCPNMDQYVQNIFMHLIRYLILVPISLCSFLYYSVLLLSRKVLFSQ